MKRVFVYYDVSGSVTLELLTRFMYAVTLRRALEPEVKYFEYGFSHRVIPFEKVRGSTAFGLGTDTKCVEVHFRKHSKKGDTALIISDGFLPEITTIPKQRYELLLMDEQR